MGDKIKTYVLQDVETFNYLKSFALDDRISAPGMRGIYQVVYTTVKTNGLKVVGNQAFVRGYCAAINLIFNTNYAAVLL